MCFFAFFDADGESYRAIITWWAPASRVQGRQRRAGSIFPAAGFQSAIQSSFAPTFCFTTRLHFLHISLLSGLVLQFTHYFPLSENRPFSSPDIPKLALGSH